MTLNKRGVLKDLNNLRKDDLNFLEIKYAKGLFLLTNE